MNTEKIEALLLTIKKGSITAAAEEMNYTPSAVSRCIQSLESEWGVRLLSRSKQGVEMTAACEILMPDLKKMIQDDQLLKEHAFLLAEGISGTIRLGICYPAFYPWVSAAMAAFKDDHPDVHYMLTNGFSSVLMEQIESNEIDLCFISRREDSYPWVQLFEDELVAILPADHPLAAEERVPIRIYEDAPYLELHSDRDTDNARALDSAGIHPRSIINLGDSSALYPMVEAGLGIGMENRINTLGHNGDFAIRPLDPPQRVSIGIAYREEILPVTRRFIEFLADSRDLLMKGL